LVVPEASEDENQAHEYDVKAGASLKIVLPNVDFRFWKVLPYDSPPYVDTTGS